MFVRPRRIAARRVHYAKNRIGSHEVPGIHRRATLCRISRKAHRVDGVDSATAAWRTAIELGLIEVDPFLVLGGGADRRYSRRSSTGGHAVTRGLRRRIQRAIVGHVVERAG